MGTEPYLCSRQVTKLMYAKMDPVTMNVMSIIKFALRSGAIVAMPMKPITASARKSTTMITATTRLVRHNALGIHKPRLRSLGWRSKYWDETEGSIVAAAGKLTFTIETKT